MNGTEVLNLAHLKELVEGAEGRGSRFVRFELEDERVMVVDRWGACCGDGPGQLSAFIPGIPKGE